MVIMVSTNDMSIIDGKIYQFVSEWCQKCDVVMDKVK